MIFVFIAGVIFFGLGFVILLRRKDYKPAIGSFVFTIVCAVLVFINISDDEKELISNNSKSETLQVTTTNEKDIVEPISVADEENQSQITNKELSIEEKIESIVVNEIGPTTNNDKNTLDGVSINEDDDGKDLLIVLNASDNLSSDMIKKSMWIGSTDILEPVSKLDEIEEFNLISVFWFLPLMDQYGANKSELVMSFQTDKEKLNKINWSNFSYSNLPDVVSNYFEHSVLQE